MPVSGLMGTQAMGAFQATAGVLYDFSPNNLEARGRYVEADAARRELQLRTVDAERQVASDVVAAFQAYIAASAEVAKAQEATILQAKAADGEREKFNAGQLSLIDLLAVQQRLENAQEADIAARLRYATALVQLRVAAGALIPPGGGRVELAWSDLTTAPSPKGDRP